MDWTIYIIVVFTGLVAGFVNTIAAGGSLITLPMLLFLNLPPAIANGTNRIAIFLQNVIGVASFKQKKVIDFKKDYLIAIPAIVGSIIGAYWAIDINEAIFKQLVGMLLVVMFFLILLKPNAWLKEKASAPTIKHPVLKYSIFFLIGVYGGFIQAGVGFFLLAALVLGAGFDLVKSNAIKVFIVLLYTAFALAIFIFNQQVDYTIGLTLAVGNMIGAWLGVRFATQKGAKYIRYILLAILLVAAAKLFNLF
ncbi:sulfite exporter TauE/SafE family protein [Prolixibacteraceae bacterium JC049]|nr:sulfite exporter TauE/SafE family protein [Prolixibacteraceae bacterium JC049]